MSAEYKTTVEKQGRLYLQTWKITDAGNSILLSEEPMRTAWEANPKAYFPATCRLCGQTWSIPMAYRESFIEYEGRGWECSYCKRGIGAR